MRYLAFTNEVYIDIKKNEVYIDIKKTLNIEGFFRNAL